MGFVHSEHFEKIGAWCLRADNALRGGHPVPAVGSPSILAVTVAELSSRGVPLSPALQATAALAAAAARTARDTARLQTALTWRLSLCAAAGLIVRVIHMGGLHLAPAPYRAHDIGALISAFLLLAVATWWGRLSLPAAWLDDAGLAAWCAAFAAGDAPPGAPAAAFMLVQRWREEEGGMSTAVSRQAGLNAWQLRHEQRACARLERLADILPLAELGGGGVAALLLMVAPLLASLAG